MIAFPETVDKIAIAGDWHHDSFYALKALNYANAQGANVIIHVGDFGYLHSADAYLRRINQFCEERDMIFMFVDGNHENHPSLLDVPVGEDGVRRILPRLWHLPRGFRWSWHGVTFMALGGAYSVNRPGSREHIDWHMEETITLGQAYNAISGGPVDVMITHDCPSGAKIPVFENVEQVFAADQLEASERHRAILRAVVDEVTPRFLFHGHYHTAYQDVLRLDQGRECLVTGLDMNGSALDKNIKMIDVYTMNDWWIAE